MHKNSVYEHMHIYNNALQKIATPPPWRLPVTLFARNVLNKIRAHIAHRVGVLHTYIDEG